MYFIFTNKDDNYYHSIYNNQDRCVRCKLKYKTGLNINNNDEIVVRKGKIVFSKKAWIYGYSYVRVVTLLNDVYMDINNFCNHYYYQTPIETNHVLVSERYYLYDPRTIKKFNIKVDARFIECVCGKGAVKFLEWWKNLGLPLESDLRIYNIAYSNGHVNVLEWFINNNFTVPPGYRIKSKCKNIKTRIINFINS